ncbi:MAG: hypothetical protein RLZZ444_4615 [Pseudomonadota bacterium]|jgi:hypothetical protein
MSEQADITVSIVGFVMQHQPNIIAFELRDAFGKAWQFHEKVPMVSFADLDEHSCYPASGSLQCTVIKRYLDGDGRLLATIDTASPGLIETVDGEHVFTVEADRLRFLEA